MPFLSSGPCAVLLTVSVADADIITALTAVGILEPFGPVKNAAENEANGATGFAFKAQDTAVLRAVAVQVSCRLMRLG